MLICSGHIIFGSVSGTAERILIEGFGGVKYLHLVSNVSLSQGLKLQTVHQKNYVNWLNNSEVTAESKKGSAGEACSEQITFLEWKQRTGVFIS